MRKEIAPYGGWRSPITSDLITRGAVPIEQVALDEADVYFTERRALEGGRSVLMRLRQGVVEELTPPGMNVRTSVHEYGGGAFLVDRGCVYFSNFADQRLYRQEPGKEPRAITAEGRMRYADGVFDRARGRIVCVREDHTREGCEAVNTLVSVRAEGDVYGVVLAEGADFYSSPRLSPDGRHLAWQSWNHPSMPWDGSEVWVGKLSQDGSIEEARRVAGGSAESVYQPAWSPDGHLCFASDRSGYWNLYRQDGDAVTPLHPMEAEFGEPQWVFGMGSYDFTDDGLIVCRYLEHNLAHLAVLDPGTGRFTTLELPFNVMGRPHALGNRILLVAASSTQPSALVSVDRNTRAVSVLRRTSTALLDPAYLSEPEAISYESAGGRTAHAFFYPPGNQDFEGPAGEKPPLLVLSHGGPTGATSPSLSLAVQYWTSRGFAVVDVNYGGSAGYGRKYRERLRGRWGVVDVEDCERAALFLAGRGDVDRRRLAIRGGSAGGYTTLAALAFTDTFRAGASHFGIGDLEIFTGDTHKFESRYMDSLIGPFPQARTTYLARSPIRHLDGFATPVIFFQGLEDKIVPPNQAELMADALRHRGVPVALIEFPGEGHGFRKAENIRRALDAELYFYSRIFHFQLADPVEPVQIDNLPGEAATR